MEIVAGQSITPLFDRHLVQSRRPLGPKFGEWQPRFVQTVMEQLADEPHASRK